MDDSIMIPNFIVVDGIDGVGKSLLVDNISKYLYDIELKPKVVHVVESTYLASEIRKYLKCEDVKTTSHTTLAFLFCAAINDVIERIIKPAQEEGDIIISDRYTMSTRVYQSNSKYTDIVCNTIDSILSPDITFVLDAPPSIIKQRALSRGSDNDVTESIDEHVVNDRRKKYARLANLANKDTYIIDASGSAEDVAMRVYDILDTYYR